jgi:hypothetical protein
MGVMLASAFAVLASADGGLLMKIAALVVALLVTGATGVALTVRESASVEGKSPEQFVRFEIEKAARLEFDTLMEQVFAHKRGSDEQRKAAIAEIKLAIYNKSYINFKCFLNAIYDAQEAGRETLDETKLEDCAKGPLSQLYTEYKIWVGFRKAMDPMIAKRCEMHARLFDGELEFPPFDFLNGNEPALFDFEEWHACLLGGER